MIDTTPLTTVAFDADDTLWHNEMLFREAEDEIARLLAPFEVEHVVKREMYRVETANLGAYGYGIKGFTLSMVELAQAVSGGRAGDAVYVEILAIGKRMLAAPVEVLPGVEEALAALEPRFRLLVVTKGDLLDQRRKLERSGLADRFHHVEVVSDKRPADYREVLRRLDLEPRELLMVGNSLKSDVLPLLELGAQAVHIPYHVTWEHERAAPLPHHAYLELADVTELVAALSASATPPTAAP